MPKISLNLSGSSVQEIGRLNQFLSKIDSSLKIKVNPSDEGKYTLEIDDPYNLILLSGMAYVLERYDDVDHFATNSQAPAPKIERKYFLVSVYNPNEKICLFTCTTLSKDMGPQLPDHQDDIDSITVGILSGAQAEQAAKIVQERKVHHSLSERMKQVDIHGGVEFLADGSVQFAVLAYKWNEVFSCLKELGIGSDAMLGKQQVIFDEDKKSSRAFPRHLKLNLTTEELDRFLQSYQEQVQQEAKRQGEIPQRAAPLFFREPASSSSSSALQGNDSSSDLKAKLASCDIVQSVSNSGNSSNIFVTFIKGKEIPDTPCTTKAMDHMRIYTPEEAGKLLDALNPAKKEEAKTAHSRKMS